MRRIESLLEALAYDGLEANFRCVLNLPSTPAGPYKSVLRELERAAASRRTAARALALKGKVLSNIGRGEEARRALRRSLEIAPGRRAARVWLSGLDLRAGRFSEASRELDRAGDCAWAPFYRAASLRGLGRDADAREALERIEPSGGDVWIAAQIVLHMSGAPPESLRGGVESYFYLDASRLYESLGDIARALDGADNACRLEGGGPELCARRDQLRIYRVEELLRDGRAAEAAAFLTRVRMDGAATTAWDSWLTGHVPRLRDECLALMRRGRLSEAGKLLNAALAAAPREMGLQLARVELLRAQGRPSRADRLSREACAMSPDRLEPAFHWAAGLAARRKFDAALRVLKGARRRCAAAAPTDIEGLLQRYCLAALTFDFEEAARIGELVLDGSRKMSHIEVLRSMQLPGMQDLYGSRTYRVRARPLLGRFLAREPRSPWARLFFLQSLGSAAYKNRQGERFEAGPSRRYDWLRYLTGIARLQVLDLSGAEKEFTAAARASSPRDWRAQCYVAEVQLCRGRARQAWASFRSARKLAPPGGARSDAAAWEAEALLWTGNYLAAAERADEALRDQSSYAYCSKGGALVKLGRPLEALKALEGCPGWYWDLEAALWRVEALYRLNRLAPALAEAERCVKRGSWNFYGFVLRGLVRGALGDREGMRRDLGAVPLEVVERVQARRRPAPDSPKDADRRILESILDSSRGVRRAKHELFVWMRP